MDEENDQPSQPEFWFASNGQLWLAHQCMQDNEPFYREYSLPGVIYKIENPESVTVQQMIQCGLCDLCGYIRDGAWITHRPQTAHRSRARHGRGNS